MKLCVLFVLFNAFFLTFTYARSLQELYEQMEAKLFDDFRMKDMPIADSGASKPRPAFMPSPSTPSPAPVLPVKIGFGKIVRGNPFQAVASSVRQPDLITKPKTVSAILNRMRGMRL